MVRPTSRSTHDPSRTSRRRYRRVDVPRPPLPQVFAPVASLACAWLGDAMRDRKSTCAGSRMLADFATGSRSRAEHAREKHRHPPLRERGSPRSAVGLLARVAGAPHAAASIRRLMGPQAQAKPGPGCEDSRSREPADGLPRFCETRPPKPVTDRVCSAIPGGRTPGTTLNRSGSAVFTNVVDHALKEAGHVLSSEHKLTVEKSVGCLARRLAHQRTTMAGRQIEA